MTLEDLRSNRDFISVENMFLNYVEDDLILRNVLQDQVELTSFYTNYNNIFPKLFAVAGANFFEKIICDFISDCFSSNNVMVSSFLSNQALEIRYHVMFDWKEPNANKFYSLFGKTFCDHMKSQLSIDSNMKQNEKNFMVLGRSRNKIVHEGISTFNLGKTANEVYVEFNKSIDFIIFVFEQLKIMHLKR